MTKINEFRIKQCDNGWYVTADVEFKDNIGKKMDHLEMIFKTLEDCLQFIKDKTAQMEQLQKKSDAR